LPLPGAEKLFAALVLLAVSACKVVVVLSWSPGVGCAGEAAQEGERRLQTSNTVAFMNTLA